jgi:hypothetical protein
MKKLFSLAFILGATICLAGDLTVQVRNHVSGAVKNRRVTLTLLDAGPVVQGPWLIAGDSIALTTDTSGQCTFTNVLAGGYRLDISGTPGRSFPLAMPDTNGVVDASSLIGATNSQPVFYTAAQVQMLIDATVSASGNNRLKFEENGISQGYIQFDP